DQRWYLSGPVGPNGEWLDDALTRGQPYTGPLPLQVRVTRPGPALELTLTIDTVPIVNARVAEILRKEAANDIQLLDVAVPSTEEPFYVVNVLTLLPCIDERASAPVVWWEEKDGRPEMLGQIKRLGHFRIDAARAGPHQMLRPKEWPVVVVVSQRTADALQRANVSAPLAVVAE
ncbi:MAG TPA: hypothetical protein VFA20_06830, partial [Myxococcaceae bacterium]|nr:hypothetical protein [Myxococcaceae bacterium]